VLLLKLIQSLVKALNSDGTPGQVAAGIALGAAFGLTPLINLHNLILFGAAIILTVSFPGVLLGWLVCTPVGFAFDPWFDRLGTWLLVDLDSLSPLWTTLYNAPGFALSNFNNTVVLGSFVTWVVAAVPLFFAARWGVARYRATIYARLQSSRFARSVAASKLYNLYTMFRP